MNPNSFAVAIIKDLAAFVAVTAFAIAVLTWAGILQ